MLDPKSQGNRPMEDDIPSLGAKRMRPDWGHASRLDDVGQELSQCAVRAVQRLFTDFLADEAGRSRRALFNSHTEMATMVSFCFSYTL